MPNHSYLDTDLCTDDCGPAPCYDHNPAYRLHCDEQDAIHEGLATELTNCYLCYLEATGEVAKDGQGPLRGIARHSTMRTHRTHPEADSYDVLHLIPCGHSLI